MTSTVLAVAGLARMGEKAGPQWKPSEPIEVAVSTPDPSVTSPTGTTVTGRFSVTTEFHHIPVDGTRIRIKVTRPLDAPAPAPVVVFLHGAGTGRAEAFDEHAARLASAGIVCVVPDKQLSRYTWMRRDYARMARDYQASIAFATTLPGVDPRGVALYGESEGAWVATILAARDPRVRAVALISAPVVSAREQFNMATATYLLQTGVPRQFLSVVPRLLGVDYPHGAFSYADTDTRAMLENLTQPLFLAYGAADTSMPIVDGPADLLAHVPHPERVIIRYYTGGNHGIHDRDYSRPLIASFVEGLARWVLDPDLAWTSSPQFAGATPTQRLRTAPTERPRWFANQWSFVVVPAGWYVLASLGAVLARRHDQTHGGPLVASVRFAASASGVCTLWTAYVAVVARLATTYRTNPTIVHGGWLALNTAGVVAVGQGVASAVQLSEAARRRVLTAAVCLQAGGWGMLGVASYLGAFSALWPDPGDAPVGTAEDDPDAETVATVP